MSVAPISSATIISSARNCPLRTMAWAEMPYSAARS